MLSIAACRNRKDLAGYCLEQGAQLNINDVYNIHESIITGKSFTTCKFLIAKGMDINKEVEWMGDILYNAAIYNHLAWVRFCLENSANPNLNLYLNSHSVLASAAQYSCVGIVSLLLEIQCNIKRQWRLSSCCMRWEAKDGEIPA